MKVIKITYNPKGLKRVDNVTPKTSLPKNDLTLEDITIKTGKDNYWKIKKNNCA